MNKILTCIFTILFTLPAMAAMTVSGTVVDSNGEPLIGATIVPDGIAGIGTTSGLDGSFSANNFPDGTQIKISYIGYKTQTVSPGNGDLGKITLKEDTEVLDDVVVSATWQSRDCNAEELAAVHASAGKTARNEGSTGIHCVPSKCVAGYKLDKQTSTCVELTCDAPRYVMNADKTDCIDQNGKECKSSDINAKSAKYKWENNQLNCIIKKCNDGYMPNDAGTACEKSEGPCSDAQIKAIEHATKGELKKGVCKATECESGYEVSQGACVAIGGNCANMPENAKTAHREYDAAAGAEVCIIDECQAGCQVSADKKSCNCPKLSEEDSEKKIEELRANAQAMKDKEQSTANKLIGAAGIGATGIGGMQMASAMAEQNADNAAEADMTAYLATFKCDYGMGKTINGGDTNIELPGGNQLLPLYTQYIQLASDLKIRKEALGMSAGIESEVILDKANTGLYDDVGTGKTGGAYTSLARALSDSTSADAAEWNAQKSETAQQLKTGATVAGIGAAGSLIANLAVNSGAKKQNKSDEINNKYEALKTLESDVAKLPNQESGAKCPAGSTGTHPNCVCTNSKQVFNVNSNSCDTCPGDKIAQNGKCACPDGTVPGDNDKCTTSRIAPKCDASDPNIKVDSTTGECSCVNGYSLTSDKQNCECPADTHLVENGLCVVKQENQQSKIATQISKIIVPGAGVQTTVLPAKNLFALGKSTLTTQAIQTVARFAGSVQQETQNNTEYCITVTGHTDKTGSKSLNDKLAQDRANAVKASLVQNGLPAANIITAGRGYSECTMEGPQESCRKVEISFSTDKCGA